MQKLNTFSYLRLFSWKVLGTLIAVINHVQLARYLSISDYGLLLFIFTIQIILVATAKLGLDDYLFKLAGQSKDSKSYQDLSFLLTLIPAFIILLSMSVVLLYSFFQKQIVSPINIYNENKLSAPQRGAVFRVGIVPAENLNVVFDIRSPAS